MSVKKIDEDTIEVSEPQPDVKVKYDRQTLTNLKHQALAELSRINLLQAEMDKE